MPTVARGEGHGKGEGREGGPAVLRAQRKDASDGDVIAIDACTSTPFAATTKHWEFHAYQCCCKVRPRNCLNAEFLVIR